GRLELKYRHVVGILRALEVDPGIFFRSLYPEPAGEAAATSRAMERLLGGLNRMGLAAVSAGSSGSSGSAGAAPAGIDPDDLERRIRAAVEEALAAGAGR